MCEREGSHVFVPFKTTSAGLHESEHKAAAAGVKHIIPHFCVEAFVHLCTRKENEQNEKKMRETGTYA